MLEIDQNYSQNIAEWLSEYIQQHSFALAMKNIKMKSIAHHLYKDFFKIKIVYYPRVFRLRIFGLKDNLDIKWETITRWLDNEENLNSHIHPSINRS